MEGRREEGKEGGERKWGPKEDRKKEDKGRKEKQKGGRERGGEEERGGSLKHTGFLRFRTRSLFATWIAELTRPSRILNDPYSLFTLVICHIPIWQKHSPSQRNPSTTPFTESKQSYGNFYNAGHLHSIQEIKPHGFYIKSKFNPLSLFCYAQIA